MRVTRSRELVARGLLAVRWWRASRRSAARRSTASPKTAAGRRQAGRPARRRGRRGDRRGRAGQPDRRLPHGHARSSRRRLGRAVNRKRVLRVMRERRLIQRRRPPASAAGGRASSAVTRPDELWHLDMTSVWVAEHGWCLPDGGDRLLHPRDRRLAPRAALPRPTSRSRSSRKQSLRAASGLGR